MAMKVYKARKKPTQARARATCDAILEASAQLLETHGYAGVTTNSIAERAGVSIGSVYEYFPNKDAIFAALKARLDRETFDSVLEQLTVLDSKKPEEFLRALLKARIRAALEQPRLEALLHDEIPASVFAAQSEASMKEFDRTMRAFVARHIDDIRIEDIDVAIGLGTTIVELTVRHFAARDPESLGDPKMVDALTDMMIRWILTDQSDRR